MRHLSLVLLLLFAFGAGGQIVDNSMVLGPPMKTIVMSGAYLDALNLVYFDWNAHRRASVIKDYKITISPQPGTNLLYIRFVPRGEPGMVGGSTKFGAEVLYTVDQSAHKIVHIAHPI